jgi:hypothetical protein
MAHEFDFTTARVVEDRRSDYPEHRFLASLGHIGPRLHVLCFTREIKIYDQEKAD